VRALFRDEFEHCGRLPITEPATRRFFWWRGAVVAPDPNGRVWAVVGDNWRPVNCADV
jgi:hypothetical protein